MKFYDMESDKLYTIADLKRDYIEFKREDELNHGETFTVELLEIIMATINGRNDFEIVGMKPHEIENILHKLIKRIEKGEN